MAKTNTDELKKMRTRILLEAQRLLNLEESAKHAAKAAREQRKLVEQLRREYIDAVEGETGE